MSDITGIIYREFRLYIKKPFDALLSFLTPLLYFFLFGISMSTSGLIATDNYLLFFLPGYVVMSVFAAVNSVVQGIFNERLSGMLSELLSCPVRISAYVVAKLLFASFTATAQTLVLLLVAVVVLPSQSFSLSSTLQLTWLLFLVGLLIASLVATIMATTVTIRSFITIVNIVNPVLMFASSIFYPIDGLPAWLRVIASINPLTWSVEAIRAVLTNTLSVGVVVPPVVGTIVLMIVAVVSNQARFRNS